MSRFGLARIACAAIVLLAPATALASDYRGFLSGVIIFAAGTFSALTSLVCFVILAFSRAYRRARVAKLHATLASVIPALGFVSMMVEGNSVPRDDVDFRLLFNFGALGLAMLPLIAHAVMSDDLADDQRPPPQS